MFKNKKAIGALFFLSISTFLVGAIERTPQNQISIPDNHQSMLMQADALFEATLYPKAATIYQKILQNLPVEDFSTTKVRLHARLFLAKSLLFSNEYSQVIKVLEDPSSDSVVEFFIAGIAYRKLLEFEKAMQRFQEYIFLKGNHIEEAQFEIALIHYFQKKEEAKEEFKTIQNGSKSHYLQQMASIYLIKIDIQEGKLRQAISSLTALQKEELSNLSLQFEISYLLGQSYFQKGEFLEAIAHFSKSFPENNPEYVEWHQESLYHLGCCYLKLGEDSSLSIDQKKKNFEKGESIFRKLIELKKEDRFFLSLGQILLAKGKSFDDPLSFKELDLLLGQVGLFNSIESKAHAILLRAKAVTSYEGKDAIYNYLIKDEWKGTPYYAQGHYLIALNHFEKGQTLFSEGSREEADIYFLKADQFFKQAYDLLKNEEKAKLSSVLKYRVQIAHLKEKKENLIEVLAVLEQFTNVKENDSSLEDPDEYIYLYALTLSKLAEITREKEDYDKVVNYLEQHGNKYPKGMFADRLLHLLASLFYKQNNLQKAEERFIDLVTEYPHSILAGEALFWAAKCAEAQNKMEKATAFRKRVYEEYPQSPFAAESFFLTYSFSDYVQGDKTALKHLQVMPLQYPNSPFIIPAYYLIGLDYKRDRKSPEGKWIRKKNLSAAIDAFQNVEQAFEELRIKKLLPNQDLEYYVMINYRAKLERAIANINVAEDSLGAKKQIYLEYAQDVLNELIHSCNAIQCKLFLDVDNRKRIIEESTFWLAQAYVKEDKRKKADEILSQMIENYRSDKITRSYYLSRTWYEKGMIALQEKDYIGALQSFSFAEDAGKGKILNADQRLELWIAQCQCYREMKDWDQAILILSKVINDDSVSSLRIKAMVLRAEIYELQGRFDLARRQLESAAKKGGGWGVIAKEKLEKEYGNGSKFSHAS